MPSLYGSAGGANRKLRELYARDSGGTTRKLRELWSRDAGGANRKVFSSGAQLAGTPGIGYVGPSPDTATYSISSSGIHVSIGFVIKPSTRTVQGYIDIPLDLQQSETFSRSNGTVLRTNQSIQATALSGDNGHGQSVSNPPSDWVIEITQEVGSPQYSNHLSGESPYYLISSGTEATWFSSSSLTTRLICLYIYFTDDVEGWINTNYQGYYGLSFTIPNGALTIIGGSGTEYPINFD